MEVKYSKYTNKARNRLEEILNILNETYFSKEGTRKCNG